MVNSGGKRPPIAKSNLAPGEWVMFPTRNGLSGPAKTPKRNTTLSTSSFRFFFQSQTLQYTTQHSTTMTTTAQEEDDNKKEEALAEWRKKKEFRRRREQINTAEKKKDDEFLLVEGGEDHSIRDDDDSEEPSITTAAKRRKLQQETVSSTSRARRRKQQHDNKQEEPSQQQQQDKEAAAAEEQDEQQEQEPVSLLDRAAELQTTMSAAEKQAAAAELEESRILKEASQVVGTKNALQAASEVAHAITYKHPMPSTWTVPRAILQQGEQHWQAVRDEWHMVTSGDDIPPPLKRFVDMKLPQPVLNVLTEKQIHKPTPIQIQGLPVALAGRDMVGIAFTGSGKTLTFTLPLVLAALEEELNMPIIAGEGPVGIVLAPSREFGTTNLRLGARLLQLHFQNTQLPATAYTIVDWWRASGRTVANGTKNWSALCRGNTGTIA